MEFDKDRKQISTSEFITDSHISTNVSSLSNRHCLRYQVDRQISRGPCLDGPRMCGLLHAERLHGVDVGRPESGNQACEERRDDEQRCEAEH